jgi:hypothetical protein
MEIVFIILFALTVVGGIAIYRSDRAGWDATFKRLSRMVRANIESSKPIKGITAKVETRAVESWEQSFKAIEQPKNVIASAPKYGEAVVEPRNQRHAITKRGYAKVSTGELWPQVVCKCGWSGKLPTGIWSQEETLRRTAEKGESHVHSQNAADEMLSKTKGNFAW